MFWEWFKVGFGIGSGILAVATLFLAPMFIIDAIRARRRVDRPLFER